MSIPKKIKVGGHVYTVEVAMDMAEWSGGKLGGHYRDKLQIRVDGSRPESLQQATLFHELMHAAQTQAYIGPDEKIEGEEWIGRMTPWLYVILTENGWLSFDREVPGG